MLSEEELRRLIESLSIREIIEPALDNWVAYESTGKTIINVKTGKIQGIRLNINELIDMSHDSEHIELYKIESEEDLFDEEELLDEEEYEKFLTPVVLIDPDSFDDITKAQMSQLMEISLWSLLKGDVSPDSFESNDNGLAIPKSAVEEEFIELFGTEITPVHGTIEGYAIDFIYDNTSETYTVPLTGVTPIYTPDVVKVEKTTDTVVVTVACLAGDAWEQGENGEMIAPTPDKYIRITLRENNENLFISAIQNTNNLFTKIIIAIVIVVVVIFAVLVLIIKKKQKKNT